jgi:hypothetical protein
MAVVDFLEKLGEGAEKAGRVAGAVGESLGKRTAEVLSGEAPEIDEEERQKKTAYEGAALSAKAQELEAQLETGRKYGTLTSQQQQEYVDAITKLYSHPSQMGTLVEKLHKAVHPQGATYQPYAALPDATPRGVPTGGTAFSDAMLAQMRQKPDWKNFRDPKTGQEVAIDVNKEEPPPGYILSSTAGGGYVRQSSHVLNPTDAISLMASTGQSYPKQDGNAWTADELKKFPPGIVLAGFIQGDKMFYAPFDQRTKTATWDNTVHQIGEAGEITAETAVPLGAARVGSITTQTAPGGGQVVTQTTTPRTPAQVLPRTTPPATTAQPVASKGIGGILPRVKPAQPQSVLPNIQGMTPRNAALAQKTQPAVSALLGIYGDPQNPSVPSLTDYAKLADDPHAQKVLGEAFKLLDQQMGEISDPGVIQTLGTAAGWANFRAQAEAGAQQAAGTEMTPQEREYFDTAIASMADIIGARAATGQSPARFSVRAMQNELPLIGLSGTADQASYLTKLETIGRQVQVGLNGMPDNSRALAWLAQRQGQIAKQKASLGRSKPGDPITQNGQKFKVTAVDQNGKVTAAEPLP